MTVMTNFIIFFIICSLCSQKVLAQTLDDSIFKIVSSPSKFYQHNTIDEFSQGAHNPPRQSKYLSTPSVSQHNSLPQAKDINSSTVLSETNIPEKIYIREFKFKGNTAFNDQTLQKLINEFINREITFSELLEVENIIRAKYQAGCQGEIRHYPCYINSDVLIPAGQKS